MTIFFKYFSVFFISILLLFLSTGVWVALSMIGVSTIALSPEDLSIAIKTFIQQAVIVGEYELDTMPSEYLNNLLSAFAKYPKYHDLMGELIKILNQYEKID